MSKAKGPWSELHQEITANYPEVPLIQLVLPYEISCIKGSLEIPLLSLQPGHNQMPLVTWSAKNIMAQTRSWSILNSPKQENKIVNKIIEDFVLYEQHCTQFKLFKSINCSAACCCDNLLHDSQSITFMYEDNLREFTCTCMLYALWLKSIRDGIVTPWSYSQSLIDEMRREITIC